MKKTTKKEDGDISEAKKEERAKKIEELKEKREAERKSDQATVDKQVSDLHQFSECTLMIFLTSLAFKLGLF